MKNATVAIFLIAFAVFLLITLVVLGSARTHNLPHTQLVMAQLPMMAGYLIAIAGGLGLVVHALLGSDAMRLGGFALAAMAGVLIASPSWGLGIGTALTVGVVVFGPALRGRPPEPGKAQSSPSKGADEG